MAHCVIKWVASHEVEISGIVDEYADFAELSRCAQQSLTVDFAGVTRMNSLGIRSWIQTIMKYKIKLQLRNCSSVVVEQFSMIPEFMGKNGDVESFFVHYQCVGCDYETKVLMQPSSDIELSATPCVDLKMAAPCPKCGEVLELDHDPDFYFTFLRILKTRNVS